MLTRASLKFVSAMLPGTGACVSIVCPMNLPGEPARDDLRLTNVFRRAEEKLKTGSAVQDQVQAAFAQVLQKLSEPRPRRYSIAAYIGANWSTVEFVPELLSQSMTVGPNFFIRPLLPLAPMLDQSFHVLALTETSYRLFECNGGFVNEKLAGAASKEGEPLKMQLQSHSVGTAAPGSRPAMMFHVGGYEPKEQTGRFFTEVDRSISGECGQTEAPLVLVAAERMASLYRETTQCAHVLGKAITKDPAYLTASEVHDVALPLVREYVESRDRAFLKSPDVERARNIRDTIQFAAQGRVHTLFVANEPGLWGAFDTLTGDSRYMPSAWMCLKIYSTWQLSNPSPMAVPRSEFRRVRYRKEG